jgi:hypothetical protein
MKMLLASNMVDFKIAFISFEVSKHKGNGFAIAKRFLNDMYSKVLQVGAVLDVGILKCIDGAVTRLFHEFHTFAINHNIRILFVWDEIQRGFPKRGLSIRNNGDIIQGH